MANKLVYVVSLIVVIVLFFYPKTAYDAGPLEIEICNCIGFGDERCFGIRVGCSVLSDIASTQKLDDQPGADIVLLFDKSYSMRGTKLTEAKSAASYLVDSVVGNDRIAIVEFDESANVLQDFTDDKTKLKSVIGLINPADETFYLPGLLKARELLRDSESPIRKLIFFSDGEPTDDEQLALVYDTIYDLSKEGICVYTIGYGDDFIETTETVLKVMADVSYEQGSCGGYHRSSVDEFVLRNVFGHIYLDQLDRELKISLTEPNMNVYQDRDVRVNLTTNVMSVCSYRLNNLPPQFMHEYDFVMRANPGYNNLHIECKSSIGKSMSDTINYEFFVKTDIRGMLEKNIRTKNIVPLNVDQVEFLLNDITELQKLEIVRQINRRGDGTLVHVIIRNTKPVTVKNLAVSQIIPRYISGNGVTSSRNFDILSESPLEMQFRFDKIEPDEIISFSYYVDKEMNAEDLQSIRTKSEYDEIDRSDMLNIIDIESYTKQSLVIEHGSRITDHYTKGKIRIEPNRNIKNLKIYLNIPKCMALRLNELYFENQNYQIVSDDPLILWQFDELDREIELGYQVDKRTAADCQDEISILTIGEPEAIIAGTQSRQFIIFIFPFLIIPLIIIVIVNKKLVSKDSSKPKIYAVKISIAIVLIVFLLFILYPKDKFEGDKLCECFGVATSKQCFGLTHDCTLPKLIVEKELSSKKECDSDCEAIEAYLTLNPLSYSSQAVDLIILLDHSKSMELGKMDKAKAALMNLILNIEGSNRISIIQFDNSSDLIQHFTKNKDVIVESINKINIGYSTKFVPALSQAHENFLNNGERSNQWQIIFVSDGAPNDKESLIYEKVTEMIKDDVCINTLGFGSEITEGSKAEEILKQMASMSQEMTGCGVYHYSDKELDPLTTALGKLYAESHKKRIDLDAQVKLNSLTLTTDEPFEIESKITSKSNFLPIPGSISIDKRKWCAPNAKMELELDKKYPIEYDESQKKYMSSISGIGIGDYDIELEATVYTEEGIPCYISDRFNVGSLSVVESEIFNLCTTDDCYEINQYLFTNTSKKHVKIYVTDYAFVPQNISISGESIVVWKNIGTRSHTVTSGTHEYNGDFHSGILKPGQSFNFTFKKGDKIDYFDNMSRMKGEMYYNYSRNFSIGNFSLEYKNNIDMSIMIDRSGSMSGRKMDNVKSAAKKLVGIVYPGDRVSIIRFSEEANILNSFTSNKDVLYKSINELHAGGKTLYVPALKKAKENYDQNARETAGRIVIFLSDGEPWDVGAPYRIYSEVQKLIDSGICIFAIGYGEEVFPGSQSEQILQQIVDMSQDSVQCGAYRYSPADQLRLMKIFGSIYHEAIGDMEGLKLAVDIKEAILDNESLNIKVKVQSDYNNNPLPGYTSKSDLCGPPAMVKTVIWSEEKIVLEKTLEYVGEYTGYRTEIFGMRPGIYKVEVTAESVGSTGNPCNYVGQSFGNLQVISSRPITVNQYFIVFLVSVLITFTIILMQKR